MKGSSDARQRRRISLNPTKNQYLTLDAKKYRQAVMW